MNSFLNDKPEFLGTQIRVRFESSILDFIKSALQIRISDQNTFAIEE